jgi:tetratricopeptide (TPR) repeat protein
MLKRFGGSMTFGSTIRRRWRLFCLLGLIVAVAGCDPESLVRQKVPEPIQELLTFSDGARKTKGRRPGKAVQVELKVTSPAPNSAHPAGKPIAFRASVRVDGEDVKNPDVAWSLFQGQGKPLKPIGRGLTLNLPFDAGSHRVDVAVSMPENVKATTSVSFRVFMSLSGKVIHNGQGLSDVDLTLTESKGEPVVARAKSAKDGTFAIEMPPQGWFKLAPSKSEFSFSPPYQMVQHVTPAVTPEFVGARAQIQQVRLTATDDSDENLQSVCPEQELRLKADIKSEAPVTNLQAALVPSATGPPKLVPVGEATFPAESQGSSAEQKTLTITVPKDLTGKEPKGVFGLRVTARDTSGNVFSTELPAAVSIDMSKCLASMFAEAVAVHEKGDFDKAVQKYTKVEQIYEAIGASATLATYMEKNFFNRGLAHLQIALALPQDDVKRVGQLSKASGDFKEVLKLHRKDGAAFLLTGLIGQLNKHQDAALENYSSAAVADPGLAAAHEFKGRVYLATKLKKNLSRAVDEFTEALTIDPHDKDLRTTRSAVLKLDIKHRDDRDDAQVDISSVPLDEVEKKLNLAKFLRK